MGDTQLSFHQGFSFVFNEAFHGGTMTPYRQEESIPSLMAIGSLLRLCAEETL